MVIGLAGEPASIFDDDPSARVLAAAVTETLVRRDAHDELIPRLAETVPPLLDGVATFVLRRGLRWHDGEPITAGDVVFAWEEDKRAPLGSEARFLADRVSAVDVVDERTVRVVYRDGERWDAYALAPRVMPRHVLTGATDRARAAFAREPVHAGPFAVAAWQPGFGVTLSAFKDYALGAPRLGRLEIRFFKDRAAVLEALRRGDIDVAPSPALEADLATTIDRFADGGDRSRLTAFYTPAESVTMLRFGRRSQVADPAVRHAIELAVDRVHITNTLFAGRARVPRSYLVPPLWAAEDGPPVAHDLRSARALLAQAGYAPGRYGIQERGPDRLTVTLLVASGSSGRIDAAHLVAGDLAAAGIAVEVGVRSAAEVESIVARGAFDLALLDEPADDPLRATDRYLGLGIGADWFDVFARTARATPARADKRLVYVELQRLWAEDAAGIPLYQLLRVDVAPRSLAGVQAPAHGGALTWNAAEWRFGGP